jgi:hypothetical protein
VDELAIVSGIRSSMVRDFNLHEDHQVINAFATCFG